MTLHPGDRKSWHGLFELFQPPTGYRLSAAFGTSFGLSLDALLAALLALAEADPETLATEPVAGVLATTRLRSRVRVLVHPGTISGSGHAGNRFVALLDRMIVEVDPAVGLFHPKVWALRFEKVGTGQSSESGSLGRLVVSSRNLGLSTSFELAAVLDGRPAPSGAKPSPLSADLGDAMSAWMKAAGERFPLAVRQLPGFFRGLEFDAPSEAADMLRLRWQGLGRPALAGVLPDTLKRAVIVSPFVQPEFLKAILARTSELQLVSTKECLDALDDTTINEIDSLGRGQRYVPLYHVTELGDLDEGQIDGVHAKLVLAEDTKGGTVTFVGSANATGPGWGLGAVANVEAMVEMRPGLSIDAFAAAFIRESKTKVHPWIREYVRANREEPDVETETEQGLLSALRQLAAVEFTLEYDMTAGRLRLSIGPMGSPQWLTTSGWEFSVAPLFLGSDNDAWTEVKRLQATPREFLRVPLEKVTSFVALRTKSHAPALEYTRLALARLDMSEEDLDRRDDIVRREIMATADPAAVLKALVEGLSYLPVQHSGQTRTGGGSSGALGGLVGSAGLERLLEAVAVRPDLIEEMRLLLGPAHAPLAKLCDDLAQVVQKVRAEGDA
jgi:hypothetical protein